MSELGYLVSLHTIDGLGPVRLAKLISHFGSAAAIWQAPIGQLKPIVGDVIAQKLIQIRTQLNPDQYLAQLQAEGIKITTIFDPDYPQVLRDLATPPIILYYWGQLPNQPTIAIVGTRKVSSYGRLVTQKFASEIAQSNVTIISGFARGVDTVAHQAALDLKQPTVAVLGTGLHQIYPAENQKLIQAVLDCGGAILTEYAPEVGPTPGNFPARNRIIAALSQGVLVTEADLNSGSLITAREALEINREVYAVPGPITAIGSKGVHHLINSGAKLVTDASDILDDLGILPVQQPRVITLDNSEQQLIDSLSVATCHIDELGRLHHLSSAQVSATLLKLEIAGLVKNLGGGNYVATI